MDLKLLKMRFKDSKQHHVMFHELYSVSLLLCISENVRFEIPYKSYILKRHFKSYSNIMLGRPVIKSEIKFADFSSLYLTKTKQRKPSKLRSKFVVPKETDKHRRGFGQKRRRSAVLMLIWFN